MDLVEELRSKFSEDKFEFSKHPVDQTILREIAVQEIREAMETGMIIEDYPDDKYGSSCLIFGYTKQKRPIHIHCSYPSRSVIKVITVYEPDPEKWIEFRQRRLR
jgi:hypothetical protein